MGLGGRDKVSKDDVRVAMNEIYGLTIKDNDTSDSVAVVNSFLKKYNLQIDEEIKKLKKKSKTLKTQKALDNNIEKIKDLEDRKLEFK